MVNFVAYLLLICLNTHISRVVLIFAMTTTLESCTSLADIRQTDGQTDHAAVTLATIVGIAGAFISAA